MGIYQELVALRGIGGLVHMRTMALKSCVLLLISVVLTSLLTTAIREPPFGAGWPPGRNALLPIPPQELSERFGMGSRQGLNTRDRLPYPAME